MIVTKPIIWTGTLEASTSAARSWAAHRQRRLCDTSRCGLWIDASYLYARGLPIDSVVCDAPVGVPEPAGIRHSLNAGIVNYAHFGSAVHCWISPHASMNLTGRSGEHGRERARVFISTYASTCTRVASGSGCWRSIPKRERPSPR